MIFNIVVDAVVQVVLYVVCRPQEYQHILGWEARERNLVFYTDNGRISGWDHNALPLTVAMFCRMGLETNL